MRSAKTLSISLPPEQLQAAEKLAKRENRTMSELFREAFRRYEQQAIAIDDPARSKTLDNLKAAVELLRQEVKQKGRKKFTMRQIDAEIAAARRERRKKLTAPDR